MKITIESTELITKQSKAGNPYDVQIGYAHLTNPDNSPQRYPREIKIFPQRNASGNNVPYAVGDYLLSPSSFSVERDFLTLATVKLLPIKKG